MTEKVTTQDIKDAFLKGTPVGELKAREEQFTTWMGNYNISVETKERARLTELLVALHQPTEIGVDGPEPTTVCVACTEHVGQPVAYPCPTMKLINYGDGEDSNNG